MGDVSGPSHGTCTSAVREQSARPRCKHGKRPRVEKEDTDAQLTRSIRDCYVPGGFALGAAASWFLVVVFGSCSLAVAVTPPPAYLLSGLRCFALPCPSSLSCCSVFVSSPFCRAWVAAEVPQAPFWDRYPGFALAKACRLLGLFLLGQVQAITRALILPGSVYWSLLVQPLVPVATLSVVSWVCLCGLMATPWVSKCRRSLWHCVGVMCGCVWRCVWVCVWVSE